MKFDCQRHKYSISVEFCEGNKNSLSRLDLKTNSLCMLYGHS